MNSPRGSARTPARLDRDSSISPQPLDSSPELSIQPSTPSEISSPDNLQNLTERPAVSAFSRLIPEIISRILWSVDANSFASLCILNRQWRAEAQKVELYAHHLSRCPSYALSNNIISGPFRRNDLSRLRAKFAAEVRRNLFDAYVHPRRTFINLVSINANSSAAFPTGEAFRFEFSPNSRTILALSSSRIYVLDATVDPPVVVRHLKTPRRPLSASITDDGSLLAVLSSKHQANIYALTSQGVKHLQVIPLDHSPKLIAISHEGTVLAASWEAGIEVFSLAANSLTTDKRGVRSEAVDTLSFSGDGSMLLGSSLSLDDPNAVVISAPFYTENDPDLSPREVHSRMWTTQILFPQISSVCSHVALLPGHNEGDACWLFAFDHSLMSYRAVRTDDTRAGVAYFLSPPGSDRFDTPIPTIAPSASACGTLAVAAFEGAGLWLYGIPERLDLSPDMGAVIERQNARRLQGQLALTSATGNVEPLMAYSPSNSTSDYFLEDDSLASKVDWRQSLFVKNQNIHGLSGQTAARWVEYGDSSNIHTSKRLVVVAPGGVSLDEDELGDESMPVDGSRMCLLDFDYVPSMSPDRVLTIEVGEGEAELLTEHTGSLAAEVAMERRRTIRAIPTTESPRMNLGRSITSVSPPTGTYFEDDLRRHSLSSPSSPSEVPRSSQPRSTGSLQRAVTASGFRHAIYPPRPPLGSAQYANQGQHAYQRANQFGRPISEDSWETPPPPYGGANSPTRPHQHPHRGMSPVREQLHPQAESAAARAPMQAPQHQYRPYRALVADRTAAALDAVMSSRAMPSGPTISQYEELMLAARSRGPSEPSVDAATETSWVSPVSPDVTTRNQLYFAYNNTTDSPNDLSPSTRPNNISHGWQGLGRSVTTPTSPNPSNDLSRPVEGYNVVNNLAPLPNNAMNFTGGVLHNRLSHSISSIPEAPRMHATPTGFMETEHVPVEPPHFTVPREGGVYPSMPTADQVANLHRRISQSELHRPPAVKNANFVHRAPASDVPPSPPRAAWGVTGVPGAPTFNQARNVPNGYSRPRSSSRGSQPANLASASASAPNLLLQRPRYGRLDTIESFVDPNGLGENHAGARSRSHSLTQPVVTTNIEPSAYHETSRAGPGLTAGKQGKKGKKKKDETTKKGSRCVVM